MLKKVLTGVLAHQALVMAKMKVERDAKHAIASQLAHDLGGPLLVVGGPYGSKISGGLFGIKAHGSGDV